MSLYYRSRRPRSSHAAFLDRDGLLIKDTGHPHQVADLRLIDGAVQLCRRLQAAGYALIVVSNQSGLARKLFDEHQYREFTTVLRHQFYQQGVRLDAILPCPHLRGGNNPRYARWCQCRKPAPGLITRAARQMGLNIRLSMMIGDSPRDLAAARRAGVRRRILFTPDPQRRHVRQRPDQIRVSRLEQISAH